MPGSKIPPHNEEAEQSVLGAILINKDSIGLISERINPLDFNNDINGKIFEAMLALHDEGKPIDILTLTKKLKKQKGSVIELSYLTELLNAVPTAANIEHYADIVAEDSTKRSLINLGSNIVEMSFLEEQSAEE